MVVCIVGIVLRCIVFSDDRICRQIQEKSTVFSDDPCHHVIKAIVFDDSLDDDICPYPKAVAPGRIRLDFRQIHSREKLQIVFIWLHHLRIIGANLSYGCSLWCVVLFVRVVYAIEFILNVCRRFGLLKVRFPFDICYSHSEIKIHFAPHFCVLITTQLS